MSQSECARLAVRAQGRPTSALRSAVAVSGLDAAAAPYGFCELVGQACRLSKRERSTCGRLSRFLSSVRVCSCGGRVGCRRGRRRGAGRWPRDPGREPAGEPSGGMDVGAGAWRVPKLLEPDRQALGGLVQAAEAIRRARRAVGRSARAGACWVRGETGAKHQHALEALARLECEAASGCSGRWEQVQGAADLSRDACGRRDRVVRKLSAVAGDASSHESADRELVR